MYKFTTASGLDIKFPRLTWAAYKKLMVKVMGVDGDRKERVRATVEALLEMGDPVLSDDEIGNLTLNDFDQLNDMFGAMKERVKPYSGGRFELSTFIPVSVQSGEANLTGFTFKAQTLQDAWDYLAEMDEMAQAEKFIQMFGKHSGDHSEVKELPFSRIWVDMMDAADVLYIQENIAGKSQGGSATWTRL